MNAGKEFLGITSDSYVSKIHLVDDVHGEATGNEIFVENCEFENVALSNRVQALVFKNCRFKTLKIYQTNLSNLLRLEDCACARLDIVGKSTEEHATIELMGEQTAIAQIEMHGELHAWNITIKDFQIVKATLDVHCRYLVIENLPICESLVILGQVYEKLEIHKSNNIKFLVIQDLTTTRIELSDNVKMDIGFEKVDAKYINLNRCTDSSLETTYLTADHLGLNGGSFNKVQFYHECMFNFRASPEANESFLPIKSFQLSSSHIAKDKTFLIEQASIEELQFSTIQNDGLIKVFNCSVTRRFIVHKSNLGRTQFTGVDINKCRIDVLDSNVHEVLFNSFRWNSDHKLSDLYDAWVLVRYKNHFHFLESLRESYRQLKANYAKNGNKIESLEFQKREMNTHFLILSQLRFKSWKNFGNYLIVATNKLFSDFGQNIWKPLCFLLVSHLLFLNLNHLLFDVGFNYPRSPSDVDWGQTWKATNLYFHTLLPTHTVNIRTLDLREVSIMGLWDFLDRIMAGYFIFYFITASRKYHFQ